MKSQNPAFVLSLLAWLASLVPAAWAQTILNPSFELDHYYVSPGYASVNGGVITGWAISDATRIGLNLGGTNSPGLFADNGAIPDGTNVAFIQSSGTTNTLSTTITGLIPGVAYQVGFRANCRSGYSQPGAESSLNGGAFVPFTCYPAVGGSHPYYTNSAVFIATGGTAVLAVRNYVASPHDGTLLVDDFSIQNLLLVTTTNESGPGSLRQIVLDAAAFGSAGPITFTSTLSGQTILLTNGPMVLSNNITINASALANGIQIDGNGQSRIIQVNGNTTVVLNSLTLINGAVAGANGGTLVNGGDGTGGGIYNAGTLTVNNCTLANNSAVGGAGGDLATGGNGSGGGIYNAGTLTVNNSTLANNSGTGGRSAGGAGPGSGGGIYNAGTLTVNNSTLANNSGNGGGDAGGNGLGYGGSGYGGGIYNVGTLTVNNSTFANNSVTGQNGGVFDGGGSGAGGGIYNAGTLTVNNSTMANNSSVGGTGGFGGTNGTVEGGGIRNALTLNLTNSIVCSNTASFNPNISGNYPNANNLVDADALLAPLGNYGGPTQTMPPEPGSPAINAGRPTLLTTDQRGSPRPVGAPDIGSVEIQPGETHTIVLNANDAGPGSLRQTILSAPGSPTITFAPDLSGQTILLTGGQIVLSNTFITIDGSELALGIQINGNGNSRIFQVNSGTFALLAALTLTNGNPGNAAAGGGIFNLGTVEVAACTLAGNSSSQGGAIENESTCILLSCTLTGNHSVNNGGAIDNNAGPLELIQCTLYGNSAGGSGGGVANFLNTLALTNCIVAENTGAGSDLFNFGSSTIAAGGTNIVQSYFNGGTFTGTGSLLAKAPLLSPLGNYGGPTLTLPPLSGSPAIDAGDTAVDTAIHITGDQRGYPRISGARVDIGAVEAQYAPANNPPVLKNPVWSSAGSGGGTFQFTFTNSAHIDFTALTSTNLALTLADWSVLGNIPEISPGVYQFADIGETNSPQRFYRVTSP